MLCFIFAALVVLLDQFFKRWIVLTLYSGGETIVIPGILSLIYVENTGAAFSILADQRWLLAGIALVAAVILVFILLRYTEGFWGTLGLAAVLGGTVGNLTDRVIFGYVVDMFRTLFVNFAIFNIADIFITLGFITFSIHFISASIKASRNEKESLRQALADEDEIKIDLSAYDFPDEKEQPDFDNYENYDDRADTNFEDTRKPEPFEFESQESHARYVAPRVQNVTATEPAPYREKPAPIEQPPPTSWQEYYESPLESKAGTVSSIDTLSFLETELKAIEDLDIDKLLRDYGFVSDDESGARG